MFKHKERRAMNLNDFVVLPNSTAKSVKLNARNLQGLKMETGSLAQERDEMEERLKRLKERMSQEKEERVQSSSYRWKSGQPRPLNNAATLINPKRTKDDKLQKLSAGKMKIRVLQDEPLTARPPPPSPATAAPKAMRKSKLKGITCGQCEVRTAGVKCAECSEDYCIGCFSKFHQKGALKFHSIIPIQTELQTHVSARDVVNSNSLQPNPSRYTSTFSSPNPHHNPAAHNHSALSDSFTDQGPVSSVTAPLTQSQDNASQILKVHGEENNKLKSSETEFSLLNEIYDEEASAKSFQDALRQWRNAAPSTAPDAMWTPPRPVTVANVPIQADLPPRGGGEGGRVPVRVEFSEGGLTLLDRLMLKKHRRNPNELAPLMDPHVNPLPQSPEKDPEATLTVEDKEVHTYLTSLFAVPTNAERSGLDNSEPGAWLTIEVLDEEDRSVAAEAKRMVNRVIPSQQTAAPNNRMSNSLSTRTTQQSIVPREIEETATSPSVCSALSSKPEPTTTTTTTPGDHHTSIKTAASKSTTPPARSQVKSPLSPLLSSSGPLYRTPKPSRSPRSICPNDSPSTGRSLTSEECDFYPKISPALRTTFTLTPSSSVESALLPKISSRNSTGSRVESPRLCQRSILDQDAVQSDNESPISPSPSKTSSRSCPRKSVDLSMNRSSLSGDDTRGDSEVCLTSQHDVTGCESMSKQRKQHFLSDLSPDDNNTSGLTGKHGAMSAGNAKESTFALIQEYRNALKSRQDSEDEMSSDSLDLTLCEEDSADDEELGAQGRVERRRSTDDRGSPASAHLHHHSAFGPRAHEEGERDLSADQAQQLSRPARVIHSFRSWSDSDSDGSSDDSPSPHSDISPNFHLKSSDAVHQNRTSLNSSTSTEMSGVDQTGCEDPDLEADATAQTLSRLERELRMLVKESGSEVFTVAPSNSRAENPGGNSLYTRRRMSKEEEDEEEALQNDRRSVLLLP